MFAVAAVAALSSCDNEGTTPMLEEEASAAAEAASVVDASVFVDSDVSSWTEVDESDLPQEVTDYLAANYPDNEIHDSWVDDNGGYVVLLDNRTAVRFDNAGAFIEAIENAGRRRDGDRPELTEVDVADLPTAITDYVAANYTDYTIEKAGTDEEGNYHVKLDGGPALIFDADGNFVEARERRENEGRDRKRGRGDKRHADDRWTAIEVADIPSVITDYVAANYAGATILRAGTDAEGNYGVVLDSEIALVFDADGAFVEERAYHEHDGDCDDEGEGDDDGSEEDGE